MNDVGLILKALEFAAWRHRTQKRKGEDQSPYINHPIQVASLLANEGGERDPVLLNAAILHDVVEDTVETTEGEQVLALTLEVTDDKSLEKQERKRLQVEQAPHKSVNAKKLKIADKIMNIREITTNPPTWWTLERILEYFELRKDDYESKMTEQLKERSVLGEAKEIINFKLH